MTTTNVQQNDALGGGGSIWGSLGNIAVNGLSRAVDGALSKKYPLTSQNEIATTDAFGNVRAKGAPGKGVGFTDSVAGIVTSPVGVAVGVSLLVGGLILLAIKIAK